MPINKKTECEECNNILCKKIRILNKYLCNKCESLDKYILITKTDAKQKYLLNDNDLSDLQSYHGKAYYIIATYYIIEDLKNKASTKYNINKDDIKEYLEKIQKEKKRKKEERKIKNALIKEDKKKKRTEKLINALTKVKLKLRNDSILCHQYIEGETDYKLEDIIIIMCQMKYLFEYCHMNECKKIAYKNQQEEIEAGYFPDCSLFDEAEYIALKKYSNGKYPIVFPWLE